MAVYGYIRVSTDRQANEGESIDVQRRQIEGWCLMHGETLAMPPFQDEGISGSVPVAERPAGKRLLDILKPGDIIVAAKLDRLFRSAFDALQTVESLKKRKVKVWLLDLGEVAGNGMAKAFLTMASAFAELERDMIRERVTTVKRDQRARGNYLGGKVPFGFRISRQTDENGREIQVLTHVETEHEVIREIKEMRASGKTFRQIRDFLEQERDRKLALATIKRIADDPAELAHEA